MKRLGLFIVLAAMAFSAGPAAAGEVLNFAEHVRVNSREVSLAQLLEKGSKPSPSVAARLAGVRVAMAPPLGRSFSLGGRVVRDRLAKARLGGVSVLIPSQITIVRALQKLSAADVGEIYTSEVKRRLRARGVKGEVHGVSANRGMKLPAGEVTTNVRFSRTVLLGRTPATVEVSVNGRRVGSVRVVGHVEVYGPVVVAARTLSRKHIIAEEDLKVVDMNLAEAGGSVVSDPDELVGQRTRTVVTAGATVELRMVERAPLIKRGQIVTMICTAPGLRVTARGKALQTGYKDGAIRLKNLTSKREVFGTVLDSGTVVVRF